MKTKKSQPIKKSSGEIQKKKLGHVAYLVWNANNNQVIGTADSKPAAIKMAKYESEERSEVLRLGDTIYIFESIGKCETTLNTRLILFDPDDKE